MGAYRWAYNKTIDYCQLGSFSYMKMRKDWKEAMLAEASWIEEIPAHTIYGAMMDASKDYKMYFKNKQKGENTKVPRCRKRTQRSFYILGNAIQEKGIYPSYLGKLRSSEPLPNKPSDSRIMCINKKWYLRTSSGVKSTSKVENQNPRVVSIDTGVRTFATCFSDTSISKIGENQFNRIFQLLLSADNLKSRMSKEKSRRKNRMKLALGRIMERVRNLVSDMHYQTISWLTNNFDVIIFPDGNFNSAIKKGKRKIGSKTVRSLLTWSFSTFRNRLKDKCELLGKRLILQNEAYTSKTINWTGEIRNIGGAKYIKADGLKVDRDINGALGILLRSLLAQPVSEKSDIAFVN